MMRIAALDDDADQLALVVQTVGQMGHQITGYSRADELIRQLRRDTYDLLLVDWELPDRSGIEVIQFVRQQLGANTPIIMLTLRSSEADVVTSLTAGADDFMTKPLRTSELQARIMAMARRTYPASQSSQSQFGEFTLDRQAKIIHYAGAPQPLKEREYDLAVVLFEHLGQLVSRQYLQETVWGLAVELSSRSLDTHISALRSKLQLRPERGFRLSAVYGHGYRLDALSDTAPGTAATSLQDSTV
ncbi:response regulator transcription factor [Chitinibacter tainanensis]|uniref:response regulator transcription factor n=1 Tax=Chitinibacter tainanensis TaxID=230667 RepID=UPI00235638F8|nr:response regulator transcription factor [Chitinibacter tainanensis]